MGWSELLAVACTTLYLTWTFVRGAIKHVTEASDSCLALAQEPLICVCAVCKECSICEQCSDGAPSLWNLYWPYLVVVCSLAGILIVYNVAVRSVACRTHFDDDYCEWEPPEPAAVAAVATAATKSGRKGRRPRITSLSTDAVYSL